LAGLLTLLAGLLIGVLPLLPALISLLVLLATLARVVFVRHFSFPSLLQPEPTGGELQRSDVLILISSADSTAPCYGWLLCVEDDAPPLLKATTSRKRLEYSLRHFAGHVGIVRGRFESLIRRFSGGAVGDLFFAVP
jgi:hypothetical protein